MGAQHSSRTTACESPPVKNDRASISAFEPGGAADPPLTPTYTAAPIVPPKPMPQLLRPETFEEKLYRKFKAEPLIPIGCLTTAYFLGAGIKSFYNRNPSKSQTMMRLRVGSQFATILIFIGYAGWNSFSFDFAPGMAVPSEQFPSMASKGKGGEGGEGGQE
eukprot:CAMPEP_0172526890 /NCGR_PEP_ID=MMETSP1067-20121228/1713_1 /TAXON_ID=265564 ORGANISM="Thalassiosira punctigera, Strain Tpunct2005C2" /NCGR_SAMPLE_ID=MMETSP1067 /ASSEMBLY_ACC=CAM_ASM_000444 /LENGTH=161 /DNA_ID=CAMNT_0013310507 /DNA_START=94 /DNA_END=579 /DNA_ORIENTATION=-